MRPSAEPAPHLPVTIALVPPTVPPVPPLSQCWHGHLARSDRVEAADGEYMPGRR
jgi:hypothetical protein